MATDRANAGTLAPNMTAKHGEVGELLHILRTTPVLGNTHAIYDDHTLRIQVNMRSIFNLLAIKAGVTLDFIPTGSLQIIDESLDSERMPADEFPVQDLGKAACARGLVGFYQDLHDSLDDGRVAAYTHLIKPRADFRRGQRCHLNRTLRVLKALERSFPERVE